MKKHVGYLLVILLIASSAFVTVRKSNESAVKAFNETFKEVQKMKWFVDKDQSVVYFEKNNVRSKITYDQAGNFVSSVRNFEEDQLPLNVLLAVKERYKGKNIKGVTEALEGSDLLYYITIEDDAFFYTIKSSPSAILEKIEKFRKQ